jgi:hypothetical protein
MDNDTFLITVEYDSVMQGYVAAYSNGKNICLDSTNYHDAVLEADLLPLSEYE